MDPLEWAIFSRWALLSILKEKRSQLRNNHAVSMGVPIAVLDLVDQILNSMPLENITKSCPCISLQSVRTRRSCEFVERGRPECHFDVTRWCMAIELVDVCNFWRGDVFVTHKTAAVRDFIYTFRFESAN